MSLQLLLELEQRVPSAADLGGALAALGVIEPGLDQAAGSLEPQREILRWLAW